jgi:hypothetical protein
MGRALHRPLQSIKTILSDKKTGWLHKATSRLRWRERLGLLFAWACRRRQRACAGAIVIPHIVVADWASGCSCGDLQEAFPSEGREVNLSMNSSANRRVINRVDAAYVCNLTNARKDTSVAAEDVFTGIRIPSQHGAGIRPILYTGIE